MHLSRIRTRRFVPPAHGEGLALARRPEGEAGGQPGEAQVGVGAIGGGFAATASRRISAATFEDLRDLGLSVAQAAQILEARYRGEIARVSDLARVPGIPEDVRDRLMVSFVN